MAQDYLLACGEHIPIDAPVVRFDDPEGFNAYLERRRFSPGRLPSKPARGCNRARRYSHRSYCRPGDSLHKLISGLRYLVYHHSVTLTALDCFKVLHDIRGLSVHLVIEDNDINGLATVYQTLDLRERDRGGGSVNNWGVNVEVVSLACADEFPDAYGKKRTIHSAYINNKSRRQWAFTKPQHESCKAVAAAICKAFSSIAPMAPWQNNMTLRDPMGQRSYGLVGHWHLSPRKWDPGPAFPWLRVQLAAQRAVWDSLDLTTDLGKQRALQCVGAALPRYGADGDFGPESREVLDKVRRAAGLGPGGWGYDLEDWIKTQLNRK